MKISEGYEYGLCLSSQFLFCCMPLRLDTYSNCTFKCHYCSSRKRGGNRKSKTINLFQPSSLSRRLQRITNSRPNSAVDEFLLQKQPIHLGGLSDPFLPLEEEKNITYETLKILADYQYPTVISTKSDLLKKDKYLSILKKGNFLVQISISTLDDKLSGKIESGTPNTSERLKLIELLSHEGIFTSCRIQPTFPKREADTISVIESCAQNGAKHVITEHLKVGFEHTQQDLDYYTKLFGFNLHKHYQKKGTTDGREWILHPEERIDQIINFKSCARKHNIKFGCADNDLQIFSDGQSCCGTDFVDGFQNHFKFNYNNAIRQGLEKNCIEIKTIDEYWRPKSTISRFVNSNSRFKKGKTTIEDYIRHNWNGSKQGTSPSSAYGVEKTGEIDDNGFSIYRMNPGIRKIISEI